MMFELVFSILIGLGFGIFLQKGRFCFTSAFRDFFAYKDTRVLKGVLAGILTMAGGVSLAYYLGAPADRFWLPSFGLSSVIGGFVFGPEWCSPEGALRAHCIARLRDISISGSSWDSLSLAISRSRLCSNPYSCRSILNL